MKLGDYFYLWGQDANSHQVCPANEVWKLPEGNWMDAATGARYLGLDNICRVVMNGLPTPPFDNESEKLKEFSNVVWSIVGDSGSLRNNMQTDLDEVLRQAGKFSNISGGVLDDFFFQPKDDSPVCARHSVETIRNIAHALHNNPGRRLDFWLVWYAQQLDLPVEKYIELFDVISFWNMASVDDYPHLQGNLQRFIEKTPGKRRYAGFYLWDYSNGCPLTEEQFDNEADIYYQALREKKIEGLVFCSNCCCGFGIPSVERARNWIRKKRAESV